MLAQLRAGCREVRASGDLAVLLEGVREADDVLAGHPQDVRHPGFKLASIHRLVSMKTVDRRRSMMQVSQSLPQRLLCLSEPSGVTKVWRLFSQPDTPARFPSWLNGVIRGGMSTTLIVFSFVFCSAGVGGQSF